MPVHLVRGASNHVLWDTCVTRFLTRLGAHRGPTDFPSHLWLAHAAQRDLLLERARVEDLPGWLAPPITFLSELAERFQLTERPIGPLSARLLVASLAGNVAHDLGLSTAAGPAGPGRGHMLDAVFGELLPEGLSPSSLARALDSLDSDEFTRRRSAWVVETYRRYLEELKRRERYDPRSVHARIARYVRSGGLLQALGGASELEVYGLTSLRGRRSLFAALDAQAEVDVHVYLPVSEVPDEWDAVASGGSEVLAGRSGAVRVQPAPDAVREAGWVARRIKSAITEGGLAPHRIAVVARSGREDTRRIHRTLERAGIPSTSRLRTPLSQIGALRAILQLLEAADRGWAYTALRPLVTSPYLAVDLDVRVLDLISSRRKPEGLEAWEADLARLLEVSRSAEEGAAGSRRFVARDLRGRGFTTALLERQLTRFADLRVRLEPLAGSRSEPAWISWTMSVLAGDLFPLREQASRPIGDRWDLVRLDQRGIIQLQELLREWRDLIEAAPELAVAEWHERLRRLLESNELALSTPSRRGVQILEAHQAGTTPFELVFLVHANDGEFPRLPRPGGVFTDEERRGLGRLGIPLASRDDVLARETALWRAVTGAEQNEISYRTVSTEGVPRLASHYVPAHDPTDEIARTAAALPDAADGPPVSRLDRLERDVATLVERRRSGESGPVVTPDPSRVRAALLNAFADELRSGGLDQPGLVIPELQSSDALPVEPGALTPDSEQARRLFGVEWPPSVRPSPWNGLLRDPVVLDALSGRFTDHEWSASQLEQYGKRPFDFLLERVLQLSQSEQAEDEVSRLTLGGLAHAILERFYRHALSEGLCEAPPGDLDGRNRDLFEQAFEEVCGSYERDANEWLGRPHVWAARREELYARIEAFLAWEMMPKNHGRPVAVERAFGRGSEHPPVDLSGPDTRGREQTLLLCGRIDRVDDLSSPGGKSSLRVVDYKSGSSVPSASQFQDGAASQAALYMAAVERLGLGTAALGVYRTLVNPANRARVRASDVEAILRLARSVPPRVRAGRFEAVQAGSTNIQDWQPGRAITRSVASVPGGHRFLEPVPGA